jgi:hypothetical protein
VVAAGEPFSDELERWLRSDGEKTLGSMSTVFAERSFAAMILLLMILPATPLPTGGVTHVFEVITVLLGLQMVIGRRTIWLPARFARRSLGATTTDKAIPFIVKVVRKVERFSRPRGVRLFENGIFYRLIGVVVIAFAVAAALAPPFTGLDTLPALGAVVVALSMIQKDVLVLAVGVALGTGGIALALTVGAALYTFVRSLL